MSKREKGDGERLQRNRRRRAATVYDAVAGRVGLNGFLDPEQRASSSATPLAPEELLSKTARGSWLRADQYNAEELRGDLEQDLPDSDLLKSIHAYASDFYDRAITDRGQHDFTSLDGTALIAIGFLLEEATRQTLGDNGDMVLVETRRLEPDPFEASISRHQVFGKVKPPPTPQGSESSETDSEGIPTKKRRT
ncbi:uncharacterized protein HMPREF1541_06428 [Cyphellophora europaea CBS 101466]|uniref:Uncharacterized protein n=1 Tax=Cyphellophora europaea (strain CBS 101466) TaxID=1220924 RepID=W2RRP7_CYPE1|nr:uncharacterized protein HMPREF1541_06428 [Cyphellophora europaea CBS 101466]ETN38393.1 hypothetical protein HMPREF1541_06428 [Cyphellophora europaea CBS 101466]